MTVAHLGSAIKTMHPAYRHADDVLVGRAMKLRYPGMYDHFSDSIQPDMDAGTIPETPKTLKIQLNQLSQGIRRAVFVARGSKFNIDPADYNARKLSVPAGVVYYDPQTIKPKEILAAFKEHNLGEILGDAQAGYGAPDKTELKPPINAVVSRTADGDTVQGVLTDAAHQQQTVDAARDVTPAGGSVKAESPEEEMANRISDTSEPESSPQAAPLKFRHPAGKKWGPPGTLR